MTINYCFRRLLMKWNALENEASLMSLIQESDQQPVLIFKHSTRCSISSMALDRLNRSWNESDLPYAKVYFLDLIAHRDLSNQIASTFQVPHESPQVLIIKNGVCVYDNSHMGINYGDIKARLSELSSQN